MAMRRSIFILAVFVAGVFVAVGGAERPAAAQNYPWCAYYNVWQGATNCGFSTFQQCLATVRGVGGSCGLNPQYQGTPAPAPTNRRLRHHPY
jgi:hypothetical protein